MASRRAATIELEADTSQIGHARRFIRGVLGDEVDADVVGDLQLIASELFSNAVEHGENTTVRLDVTIGHDVAGVSVHSRGATTRIGPAAEWHVSDPDAVTGRGLGIVRRLADDIIVERDADVVTITAHRTLRSSTSASETLPSSTSG
jgi:anti-sigma regulatory factor (Ser/Thr protein kinase)